MPLSRYLVRNEYGLADPDLYRVADKDDPEALLEGVAMAGLVGVLRQLGDLAEFSAEMFHNLHGEVMATAARGHALIARVQQLEAEFPSMEKILLSQTTHIPFLYNSGVDWHSNIRLDENLVTQGDMPRFVMDSYEECRGPPRLFLLDMFDVAGAGACLKRYSDPSFFKAESTDSCIKKSEGQREKGIRKVKRRGPRWRNGGTPEVFPSSHAKLHQLLLDEHIESGGNDPERRVKLKKRPLEGFQRDEKFKSYMQKSLDTCSPEYKVVREISLDLVPMNFGSNTDICQPGLEIVEIGTFSPSRDKITYSSLSIPEVVKPSINELNEVTDGGNMEIPGANYETDTYKLSLLSKDVTDEELAADIGSGSEGSVGEYNTDDISSEIDNYVDALATMESEVETDSVYRTKRDLWYLNNGKKTIDSDGSEEQQDQQNTLLDYHSVDNSIISENGSSLKKDIDSFTCSVNVSNFAENTLDGAEEATAKSFSVGSVNSEADDKSVIREAQGHKVEEYMASDAAESLGKNSLVEAELNDIPWSSVEADNAMTKIDEKWIEQTDRESREQAVLHAYPNDGYDHPMRTGKPLVEEMAAESSDTAVDVLLDHSDMPDKISSHPQSEYAKDGRSTSFNEMTSSSASSPAGKPIHDLSQPVEEASSDGLSVLQKSSVSAREDPEPVFLACGDDNLTPTTREKSEDQPHVLGVVQDNEQPEGYIAGALYGCMPHQLSLSEDALPCSGDETNVEKVSMDADGAALVELVVSLATDNDVVVEPRVSTAANSEDSSTPAVDHADRESPTMEICYGPELPCLGRAEFTGRLEFDSSEIEVAHSVDESGDKTLCESTGELTGKTTMNTDGSSNLNLVVNPSQIDQVSKITDMLSFDGQMVGAGSRASPTVAYREGISKSAKIDEVESDLNVDAVKNHNDYHAMCQDQPGPAAVCSNDVGLMDATESLQAEGVAISFDGKTDWKDTAIFSEIVSTDSPSYHLPERKNDLDMDHSVRGLEHAETEVASARHDCLKVENTKTEGQLLSSVLDCSATCLANKQLEEYLSIGKDPSQNCEGSQMQSLKCHTEVDLQNPVSPRRDDCVNSDSIVCDTSKDPSILRLGDNVHDTCLAEADKTTLCPTLIECDQHLERSNSGSFKVVEDEEHDLDTLVNVHKNSQIALDKAIETQDVEITVETFKAREETSQQLEYAEQILSPESGNEMCSNPSSVSGLAASLSQPLVADLPVQSDYYKPESQPVGGELLAPTGSISLPKVPLVAEVSAQSADHKLESTGRAMQQLAADFSSISLLPDGAQVSLKVGNTGQTMDLSQVSLPLFGSSPVPAHYKPGEMPPLPLPPMQWRLGRNQHTSLASKGLMRSLGTAQPLNSPEASDNAGLRSQKSVGAQHLNPFLSLSDEGENFQHAAGYSGSNVHQPTSSMLSMPGMVHEGSQQHTIGVDQRLDAQLCKGSQGDWPASDTEMDKFSLGPLESGLLTEGATSGHTPILMEEVIQKETAVTDDQCEHISSEQVTAVTYEQCEHISSEQETAVVDEQLEHVTEKEIAASSDQFEPLLSMQFAHQFLHGFMALESQGIWSADAFGTDGTVQKKIPRPRNPLIDAVVALDKSKLRKVSERVKLHDKSEAEKRDQHLPQLRKVGQRVKPQDAMKAEESFHNFPPLRKIGEKVKPQDLSTTVDSAQHLPQLRKLVEEIISQDRPTTEENTQHLPQLRKVGERIKHQDGPTTEEDTQHLPQLRKVWERINPQDEPDAEERKQSLPPLRGVGGRLKPQDGPVAEGRDSLLEQIRNKSFNLKPAAASRPSIQGSQTNLKVAAILEKANTIRQAMAGSDEDDSDGWSDN